MDDQFDPELVDRALLEELQLAIELIVAANESDGPMSQEEIDRILGVPPPPVPKPRASDVGKDTEHAGGRKRGSPR